MAHLEGVQKSMIRLSTHLASIEKSPRFLRYNCDRAVEVNDPEFRDLQVQWKAFREMATGHVLQSQIRKGVSSNLSTDDASMTTINSVLDSCFYLL